MDIHEGLVNGSRGVVVGFVDDIPVVKFMNGKERVIDYHIWEVEENDKKIMRMIQIPLKLAWCLTIHKCVNENTLIYTENGIKRIHKISNDMFPDQKSQETKEISIGIMGKNGLQEATQIYKGVVEDTYIVTTSLGYKIEGSYRHPVLTYEKEEKWVKLPDIKIDDFLMLKSGSNCYGKNIETKSFVSNHDIKIKYNIPAIVEEKLCYLLGLLIGDGCYSTKRNYPVEFVVHKNVVGIKEKYIEYFKEIFGRDCKVYNSQKRNICKLMVNSKHIRDFFEWCGLGYDTSYTKTIPWVVLENTRESQISCLKGLFDTDGGVNKCCVHFTTVSHQLALDIQNILLNLGIIASLRELNGESRKTFRQAYRLQITGYQAHLYYKFIGFEDVEKQRKLAEKYTIYTPNTIKSNICEVPNGNKLIQDFREEIYRFYNVKKRCNDIPKSYRMILSRIINGRSKLRWGHVELLCTGLSIDIETIGPAGKTLMYFYKNGIFFDKVVKIEKSKSQLYDLYLPGDHTFVGNGIINHNSQGCTLDCVEIDLGNVFEYGQAYVGLSRVKNIEGVSIIELDVDKITAHPKAVKYYKSLK
jgi:intein/homing endonuclease